MTRRRLTKAKRFSPFKFFPCLRCGRLTVAALIPEAFNSLELRDLTCKRCATPHFLIARVEDGMWWAVYDRDTRRYSSDYYDEMPFVRVEVPNVPLSQPEDDDAPYPHYGPISIYRCKRFSPEEIQTIWLQSRRRCHICGKGWRLNQHGRTGWHVDHWIPNSGGGRDTEMMDNFRVACASCNLKKGRGYTARSIRKALRTLFV